MKTDHTTAHSPSDVAGHVEPADSDHHAHPASGHAAAGHGGHDKHAGHDPEAFRRRFWLTSAGDHPARGDEPHGDGLVQLLHRLPGDVVARAGARVVRVLVGWLAVPRRRRRRGPRPPARDDAADLAGDHRRLRVVDGDQPRLARPGVLVGARRAGDDHAARPLAGDEGDRPGPRCAGRAGRAVARRRRGDRRRRDPHRRGGRAVGRRRRAGPSRRPGPG